PQATEKAMEEIRRLIDEAAQLAQKPIEVPEFGRGLLNLTTAALAAVGGAVWVREGNGPLELIYQIALEKTGLAGDEARNQKHGKLLLHVMQKKEAIYVPPHAGLGDGGEELNGSDFLVLLAPLIHDGNAVGVMEVFKPAGGLPSARKGYLRFLSQMAALATDFFKNHDLRTLKQRQTVWGEFENFTRTVHASLDARSTCYTIANEGRRFIDADRLSVAITRGKSSWIEAISGQDVLNRRSNTVRLLDKVVNTVIRTDEPFWYTDETHQDVAPQIENALNAYIDESHARALAVLPLRKPKAASDMPEDGSGPLKRSKVIGALVVEYFDRGTFDDSTRHRMDSVAEHAAVALDNSLQHSQIFLLPLWRALGKLLWYILGRRLLQSSFILVGIAALVLAMVFVPYDFNLEGQGKLYPKLRRDVFAPFDGDVAEVRIRHGDSVKVGDELVLLESVDLQMRKDELQGKLLTTQEQLRSVEAILRSSKAGNDDVEKQRTSAQKLELDETIKSLKRQMELVKQKEAELSVRSPIAGQVTSWDVEKTLAARPVQRGQVLLNVADVNQSWELEVLMPEDRMAHIIAAQKALPAGEKLRVDFILATNPGTTYTGSLREIAMSADVDQEQGNTVLLKVDFDRDQLPPQLHYGAKVIAKVHCGKEALGYVWFHDVVEFVQTQILFRL
ncbi:MAG TPA: HlyD family efflux transporter periplasmic adaptor subunit, partial [Pirellulales bacterium]